MESNLDFDITSYFPILDKDADSIPKNEIIKVKFEVDINPPESAAFERKFRLQPVPYEVNLYDEASLFAGKLHND